MLPDLVQLDRSCSLRRVSRAFLLRLVVPSLFGCVVCTFLPRLAGSHLPLPFVWVAPSSFD